MGTRGRWIAVFLFAPLFLTACGKGSPGPTTTTAPRTARANCFQIDGDLDRAESILKRVAPTGAKPAPTDADQLKAVEDNLLRFSLQVADRAIADKARAFSDDLGLVRVSFAAPDMPKFKIVSPYHDYATTAQVHLISLRVMCDLAAR